jgi:hypothetical protein
VEIDTFRSYDAVDFARYLEIWRRNQEKQATQKPVEGGQKEESETNTTNRDIGTGKGSSETAATSTVTDQTTSTNSGSHGTTKTPTTTVSNRSPQGTVKRSACPSANPPSNLPSRGKSSSNGNQSSQSGNPAIVTGTEDHTSINSSKSSNSKKASKFKNVFSFGKKKGSCLIGLSSNSGGSGKVSEKGRVSKVENERIIQRTESLLDNMNKRQ